MHVCICVYVGVYAYVDQKTNNDHISTYSLWNLTEESLRNLTEAIRIDNKHLYIHRHLAESVE